jgi:hypothetical protein
MTDGLYRLLGVKQPPNGPLLPQLRAGASALTASEQEKAIELVGTALSSADAAPLLLRASATTGSSSLLSLLLRTALREGLVEAVLSKAMEEPELAPPLLRHLRWLATPPALEDLAGLLEAAERETQLSLIPLLPSIIAETEHVAALATLEDLLAGDSDLIGPVLDAVGGLRIPATEEVRAQSIALNALPSAPTSALPSLLRFALQTARSADQVAALVREVRAHVRPSASPLLLEALRVGLAFRADVAKQWLVEVKTAAASAAARKVRKKKAKAKVKTPAGSSLVALDVWAVVLASGPARLLTDASPRLLGEALPGLASRFDDVLALASSLLRRGVTTLFASAWSAFEAPPLRQALVEALTAHVGTPKTATAALGVLLALPTATLTPYASFLYALIDFVQALSVPQLRQLFTLLRPLVPPDQLRITLRKHVHHADPVYKNVGIVGGVVLVREHLSRLGCQLPRAASAPRRRGLESCWGVDWQLWSTGGAGGGLRTAGGRRRSAGAAPSVTGPAAERAARSIIDLWKWWSQNVSNP